MNKDFELNKESEEALENYLLQRYDPLNWQMGYSCELEDLPAIIPLIEIKDNGGKGRTFMFGNDIHDTLVVETENNRSGIYYLNLQNSCSSRFCDEGYEIVDNGNIKGDYVEPHIRLVNLKQCIERYNKNNGIDELKKENKKLRKLSKDYAKQCEDNFNKLENLKKCFVALQEQSAKDITKLHKENEILLQALKSACKRYWDDCGMEDCPYGENESFDANNKKCQSCSDESGMTENKDGCCWVEFFKSQAESDIKNEKE